MKREIYITEEWGGIPAGSTVYLSPADGSPYVDKPRAAWLLGNGKAATDKPAPAEPATVATIERQARKRRKVSKEERAAS